jgi:hypothetical protein
MARVLAVHRDRTVGGMIETLICDACKNVMVDFALNEEMARTRLQHQESVGDMYDIIITPVGIPANQREAGNDSAERGIALLHSLPDLGHSGKAGILIAHRNDFNLQSRTKGIDELYVITDDQDFDGQLTECVKWVFSKTPPPKPRMLAIVTLTLDLANHHWEYTIKGQGFKYEDGPKPLIIDTREIERLLKLSQRPPREAPFWKDDLRDIGNELANHIFSNNLDFHEHFVAAVTKAGGNDHKVIRFNTEEKVHPMLLEALTPSSAQDFWMLEVPIYRHLIVGKQNALEKTPIFCQEKHDKPFRALIIESQTSGDVEIGPLKLDLARLEYVSSEADWLESHFRRSGALQVDRISLQNIPADKTFKKHLEALLHRPDGSPDIVHYCGHTHYDKESGEGYLILPGEPPDNVLKLEEFSAWLPQTSFLFLSGCQSSEQGFVYQLAGRQVPIVLGFRWPIGDESAFEFTKAFYTSLFEGESAYCFERAFLLARRALRFNAQYANNTIWAAPILIMQDTN